MKFNLKDFLLRGSLNREQFQKVQPLVSDENRHALLLSLIVQLLYFGACLLGSLGVSEMVSKRLVYGIGTAIPAVLLIVQLLIGRRHPGWQTALIRLFCVGIMITGMLCSLISEPNDFTIMLLIFFFAVPMIFVAPPVELIVLVACTDIVYFILAPGIKPANILRMDIIDVVVYSTLGMVLGIFQMRGRYRRYWLETEAVDLADVRYRAAFIDQLTGAFNRNAYNKDMDAQKSAPEDLLYMALDLNGLKAANDTFGHVAGDELIIATAHCMQKVFGDCGKVYRIGGDEFTAVVRTGERSAGELLDALNAAVDGWKGSIVNKLSVSYGVVVGAEARTMTLHEVELLADKRMYQAKSDYYKTAGIDRRRR